MITYGKTIFSTYTYARSRLLGDCWRTANNDFNRYIQRLRRLHANDVQYLRTIEAYNDGYPHFHAILRFKTVLTITNGRYVDKTLYQRWKHLWVCGLSDHQVPRSKQSPIAYIIKYATKNSGVNIWRHYYANIAKDQLKHEIAPATATISTIPSTAISVPTELELVCIKHKIKQTTWSRKFFKELHTK